MALLATIEQPVAFDLDEVSAIECFDAASRYFLGISGEEFAHRLSLGEFSPLDNFPGAIEVAHLMPASFRPSSTVS